MANRAIPIALLIATTAAGMLPAEAATRSSPQGHFGPVLELDADFGGDNVARVFYTDGSTQDIKAGRGVVPAVGVHYHLASAPVDFVLTAGYKFVTTRADNADIHIDRVEIKALGTYELPRNFWIDAGPVWHTGIRFHGGGFIPDFSFNDAVGAAVGFGWRWIGIAYTDIHYSSPVTGDVDASNAGITLAYEF